MSNITKEIFLRQKIKNFIIFIEKKIGRDNNVFKDFEGYAENLNSFLQAIIQINTLTKGNLTAENIAKYLEMKGVSHKISQEDLIIVGRYFAMFIKIINS